MKASRLPQVLVSFLLLACFALGGGTALAAVPQTLNYQGFLTNKTTGAPLSQTVSVTFKLYDALTAGTLLYTETQPSVTVTNGVFNAQIGLVTPLTTVPFDRPYWLEVNVGTDILQPRQPLASSAYARSASNIVTPGIANTAVGFNALNSNTTGSYNTANGQYTLFSNTTGFNNTVTGAQSLYSNTTGYFNTVTGTQAMYPNTTGFDNTANGMQALFNSTTGSDNTAVGMQAQYYNNTGSFNTALGSSALRANNSGSNNIGIGVSGGAALTSGNFNIDIGNAGVAGEGNTIRIGDSSQTRAFVSGIRAVITGNNDAQPVVIDSTGQLGSVTCASGQVLQFDGSKWICNIGFNVVPPSGADNIAVGALALWGNFSGGFNVAIGGSALSGNQYGSGNVAVGEGAMAGSYNGANNVAIGVGAMSTGYYGLANNIAIGYQSGMNLANPNNIDIGNSGFPTDTGIIRIGTALTHTATYIAGALYNPSDRNLKDNFSPVDEQELLDKVASLPLLHWSYKNDGQHVLHVGPMAQDFYASFKVGADDRHIATIDEGGVALAAIKGLNQKLERAVNEQASQLQAQGSQLQAQASQLQAQADKLAQLDIQAAKIAELEKQAALVVELQHTVMLLLSRTPENQSVSLAR